MCYIDLNVQKIIHRKKFVKLFLLFFLRPLIFPPFQADI